MHRLRLSKNTAKNLIIALLVVSAFFLAGETNLLDSFFLISNFSDTVSGILGMERTTDTGGVGASGSAHLSIRPFFIAVNSREADEVSRYGVKYDSDMIRQVYDKYSAVLGGALGSSGTPEPITRGQWELALTKNSVYFDFLFDCSLDLLSQRLGTPMTGEAADHYARRICLSQEDNSLLLYYYNEEDRSYFRCSTALSSTYFLQQLKDVQPNGSYFAFERDSLTKLDPDTMFVGALPDLGSLRVGNPLGTGDEYYLNVFSMNSYIAKRYDEPDGTILYVEGDSSLQLSPDGDIIFRNTTDAGGVRIPSAAAVPSISEAVDAAYSLIQSSAGKLLGEAGIILTRAEFNSDTGEYRMSFGYIVRGIPVYIAGGADAIEISTQGQYITRVQMTLRQYLFSNEPSLLLPEVQQAAVFQAGLGGEMLLVYYENGGQATLKWIKAGQ